MKKNLFGKKFQTITISGLSCLVRICPDGPSLELIHSDYQSLREYLTVYVNITDNQTIGCSLIYIMEKFFVVELKPGSIAERSG